MKLELGYTFQIDFIWGTHNERHMLHIIMQIHLKCKGIDSWMDGCKDVQ